MPRAATDYDRDLTGRANLRLGRRLQRLVRPDSRWAATNPSIASSAKWLGSLYNRVIVGGLLVDVESGGHPLQSEAVDRLVYANCCPFCGQPVNRLTNFGEPVSR